MNDEPDVGSTTWLRDESCRLVDLSIIATSNRRPEEALQLAQLAAAYATIAEMQSRELDRIVR